VWRGAQPKGSDVARTARRAPTAAVCSARHFRYEGFVKTIQVVGAAIAQDGRCLVAQRGPSQNLAGKWEFPGGKIEAGESPQAALRREIFEELGLTIAVGHSLGQGEVVSTGRRIVLEVYTAALEAGSVELREHAQVVWATATELSNFDWAEADVPIVASVARWLRGAN
jgi:8-oxo-dGTP diphosphatase